MRDRWEEAPHPPPGNLVSEPVTPSAPRAPPIGSRSDGDTLAERGRHRGFGFGAAAQPLPAARIAALLLRRAPASPLFDLREPRRFPRHRRQWG